MGGARQKMQEVHRVQKIGGWKIRLEKVEEGVQRRGEEERKR